MSIRKIVFLLLLLLLCLMLSGCRTRIAGREQAGSEDPRETAVNSMSVSGALSGEDAEKQEKSEDMGGRTKENPEASRKEYDDNAPAEIVPGTDRAVHSEGEGGGAFDRVLD